VLAELADGRKGGGANFTTVIDPLSRRVRPTLAPVPGSRSSKERESGTPTRLLKIIVYSPSREELGSFMVLADNRDQNIQPELLETMGRAVVTSSLIELIADAIENEGEADIHVNLPPQES
jgi:hypothetical protein